MTGKTKTPEEVLDMSDEEFAKLTVPPAVTPAKEETPEEKAAREAAEAEVAEQAAAAEAAEAERLAAEQAAAGEGGDKGESDELPPTQVENKSKVDDKDQNGGNLPPTKLNDGKETPPAKPEGQPPEKAETPINYEEAYKGLMDPIVANGKTIELRSPAELRQLAQMGANYTKKMQAIAPHRKVLMMLENNGLLDEGKLSYLIDLDKKNPEAIKKLVKDAGINPLDIDTEAESTYQQGNHRVTDAEAAFTTQLEDLQSTPEGVQTIQTINAWDQASKEVLWTNPGLMATIHTQRNNGIYNAIATEIDRRRTLGIIPAELPFLQAYKAVGDELHASGAFNKLSQPKPEKTPVATRTATPKPVVKNGDKANAAAPSRSTPKVTKPFVNPLSMSDDEFMKEFKDRL